MAGKNTILIVDDGTFLAMTYFTREDSITNSTFTLIFTPEQVGTYLLDIYLDDGFRSTQLKIGNETFQKDDKGRNTLTQDFEKDLQAAIPLVVIFISVPGCVVLISTKQLNKLKRNKKNDIANFKNQ